MKVLLRFFRRQTSYQFAIKKCMLSMGKEVLIPVMKHPGMFQEWMPIVRIYDKYYIAPGLEVEKEFSHDECMDHIKGYIKQLEASQREKIRSIEYINHFDFSEP